jgi:hypothetical protein
MPISRHRIHLTTEPAPVAPLPPPPQIPACPCGCDRPRFRWAPMRDGRRHLRAECSECGRFIKFVPQIWPFLALVEEEASDAGH